MNTCGSEHGELRTEVTCQFTGNTEDKWPVIRKLKCISNINKFILANNSLALKLLKPNSLSSLHQTHNKKIISMSHWMSHLTFSAFKSVFDHCVASLKKCSPFCDNINITGDSWCYGMSRKLVPLCYDWNKLFLYSVTKLRQELLWYCNLHITLKI